ncbi:hypothetical protein JL107_08475 [Nakamurella flavida]|uniref:Uncharacterized protein n=1 Tax=Nakamurella flavida TaxID=363630 RepID=A0A939C090_9ACTN|nr:hypothetical protein [Nakamurella flavida]MBM9476473.1 hypothetical protein [Nakamurella flavida]MDP9779427.1 hypothetical protein [Nakamurella flavida]
MCCRTWPFGADADSLVDGAVGQRGLQVRGQAFDLTRIEPGVCLARLINPVVAEPREIVVGAGQVALTPGVGGVSVGLALPDGQVSGELGDWLRALQGMSGVVADLALDALDHVIALTGQINASQAGIGERLGKGAPALLAMPGCGAVTAAEHW